MTATNLANTTYNWSAKPTDPLHGAFAPNNQQRNATVFTPAQRRMDWPIVKTVLGLGFDGGAVVIKQPAWIVEMDAVKMLMGEARDRRISAAERTGLLWVAVNRIGDNRFAGSGSLTGVLNARTPSGGHEFGLWNGNSRAACPNLLTRLEYDRITDIAGGVLSNQTADNTRGAFAFYTPTRNDVAVILKALADGLTKDARDIGLRNPPTFNRASVQAVQIVLIANSRPLTDTPRPFIFFREQPRGSPTVLDLRGGN
jgi:hypothetical protein